MLAQPARILHRWVEGMPLAIELAAASVGTRTCAEIARELERGLSFLQTDLRDVPARHRSAQAAFEYSWRLLTPAEQRAFIAFSVFRRGGAPEAAHQVTDAAPAVLDALVNKSLLRFLPTKRYEMHELLRQYAAERLAALPEQETAARDKHCAHYTAFLQQREDALFGADAARAQAAIRAEMDNIRAAWDWAVAHARAGEIARGLNGLARFYTLVGPFSEGEKLIGRAVECVRALDEQNVQILLSRLLVEQARIQSKMGMCDQALAATREAIDLARRADATDAMALGYMIQGLALCYKSAHRAAQTQIEQCLALAQPASAQFIRAEGLKVLSNVYMNLGDYADAITISAQARHISHKMGHQKGEGEALLNIGCAHIYKGDYLEGANYLTQALGIFRRIGDRRSEGVAQVDLGLTYNQQGDYVVAKTHYQEGLQISRELGDRLGEGVATINLGYISDQLGEYASAKIYYGQTLCIYREIGARTEESLSLSCLGLLSHHIGDNETAYQNCQQATQIAQEVGARNVQAYALTRLGHALTGLNRLAEAADAYQQALDIRRALGQQNLAMEPLAGLARVALAQENLSQAQTQVEEILKHLETHNFDGTDEPFRIYLTCYRVLRASRDARARTILATAQRLLQERAARISDETARRSFLENVPHHREIINCQLPIDN
ncbi:MAG: tetratricopeptide repeat protein [Chloroflexi bacterium]|nr:tetratricopeptide repeat protein [Chloroflexota bacterium]